ncbi:MAG: hypothetical protein IJ468_13745 [Lachnospiraceae bacterium]|nr:hypothetical protein [Lachnospiraceae bacterium]
MKRMKKILTLILILSFIYHITLIPTYAVESTTTYLDNGDYIVTEYTFSNPLARETTGGVIKETYYSSDNVAKFALILDAAFYYTYGVSAYATSATATVQIYSTDASFISKKAYTSVNNAYAEAVIRYNTFEVPMKIQLSCNIYGDLYQA